ncbi:MAG: Hydroxyacylglutathione hydrolase [Syntrophus sp. PtaU1.Bin208]|nr:MAG: Hydroxyacylglutathione hydrolase [Syntrophus sp. PtaU1.Bin208]
MIEEIADGFYRIKLPMPFRLDHIMSFVLVSGKKITLIDTDLDIPEGFSTLEGALQQIGRSPADIGQIFLTHYHADHCGLAGRLKEMSGARIYLSEADAEAIENQNRTEALFQHLRAFCREQDFPEDLVASLQELHAYFTGVTFPFEVDEYLAPHSWHTSGHRTFQVIPVPGHTRGQVCFHFPREALLLSGDHVLPEITPNLSIDLFHPEWHPLESFLESLQRVKKLTADRTFPSHGEVIQDLQARIEEMEAHHEERKQLILRAVRQGSDTGREISLKIFGADLPEFDQYLALHETCVHLLELKSEGLIREIRSGVIKRYLP